MKSSRLEKVFSSLQCGETLCKILQIPFLDTFTETYRYEPDHCAFTYRRLGPSVV